MCVCLLHFFTFGITGTTHLACIKISTFCFSDIPCPLFKFCLFGFFFWLLFDRPLQVEGSMSQAPPPFASSSSISQEDPQHPRRLIPELCRLFYSLGWVTGTGGGISLKVKIFPSLVNTRRWLMMMMMVMGCQIGPRGHLYCSQWGSEGAYTARGYVCVQC